MRYLNISPIMRYHISSIMRYLNISLIMRYLNVIPNEVLWSPMNIQYIPNVKKMVEKSNAANENSVNNYDEIIVQLLYNQNHVQF